MTNEETQQVQTYIQGLQARHALALQRETESRRTAQADSLKMGQALVHIWNYSLTNPNMPPAEFMVCVRQMMNHYCPDFDIPF